jgi:hypothetical protein
LQRRSAPLDDRLGRELVIAVRRARSPRCELEANRLRLRLRFQH